MIQVLGMHLVAARGFRYPPLYRFPEIHPENNNIIKLLTQFILEDYLINIITNHLYKLHIYCKIPHLLVTFNTNGIQKLLNISFCFYKIILCFLLKNIKLHIFAILLLEEQDRIFVFRYLICSHIN